MKRILHIGPALPPDGKGGQEKCMLKILQYFQKTYKLNILIKEGKSQEGRYSIYKFEPNFSIKNNVIFYKKLKFLLKRIDLVHFHYPDALFPKILIIPIFLFLNHFYKKKYIIHIHLMPSYTHFLWKIFQIPYYFITKIFFIRATRIFTPTEFTKYSIYKNFKLNLNNIKIVPYGVANINFNLNLKRSIKNFKKIIFIGRLHPSKQVNRLIKAILQLTDDFKLSIYGDGPERKNLEKISKNNSRIKFYGYIEDEQHLSSAFEDADLMILPSKVEEMPLSIMESLAAGVPVICTNLPSIKSIYKDHIFYIDNCKNELIDTIYKVTSSNNDQVIKRGRSFAHNYTWEKHFKKIQSEYLEILMKK